MNLSHLLAIAIISILKASRIPKIQDQNEKVSSSTFSIPGSPTEKARYESSWEVGLPTTNETLEGVYLPKFFNAFSREMILALRNQRSQEILRNEENQEILSPDAPLNLSGSNEDEEDYESNWIKELPTTDKALPGVHLPKFLNEAADEMERIIINGNHDNDDDGHGDDGEDTVQIVDLDDQGDDDEGWNGDSEAVILLGDIFSGGLDDNGDDDDGFDPNDDYNYSGYEDY